VKWWKEILRCWNIIKYHKISPFTFSDWQKTGRKLAEVLSCKLSAWLLKSGYFKGCVWLIFCERSNRRRLISEMLQPPAKRCGFLIFSENVDYEITNTHISNRLETGWSKVDAASVSKTLPKCWDREADKMIAELRNYGPVWWPVGLKFGTLGTCTVSLIHQIHRKTMKHQQLLVDAYRCHITATTHNKEAW